MYALTYTYNTHINGVETYTKHYKTENDCVIVAKALQAQFCIDFKMKDTWEHDYGDPLNGEEVYNVWHEITGVGTFETAADCGSTLNIIIQEAVIDKI